MGRKFAISVEQLEAARQVLAKTPAPEAKAFTKRQAIERLRPELEAMRARGDSFEAMAAALCKAGVPIGAAVLRAYWNETTDLAATTAKGVRSARVRPRTRSAKVNVAAGADGDHAGATRDAAPAQPARSASAVGAPQPPQAPRGEVAKPVAATPTAPPPAPAAPAPPVRRSQFTVREDSEKL
jgi:hypothetical protein